MRFVGFNRRLPDWMLKNKSEFEIPKGMQIMDIDKSAELRLSDQAMENQIITSTSGLVDIYDHYTVFE